MNAAPTIRDLEPGESEALGRLMVNVYSSLEGFPKPAMRIAWGLYERLGFERSEDLDFLQQGFPVYGFRLALQASPARASSNG